ncbi:MAG: hypothetical protein M1814_004263 [Vezdaea aestivalis]|nr:MAG: hypothetical protein M1814_004263 [Vezdaea aestivalis]
MSRAAWHGTRIILEQVSAESVDIYDFIIQVHTWCSGDWERLSGKLACDDNEVQYFLEYGSTFLSNVGNYYGSGDQKIVPKFSADFLAALSTLSEALSALHDKIATSIFSRPPFSLGFPGKQSQSAYYPGTQLISKEEIALVSQALQERSVFPENTRLRKSFIEKTPLFEVLQASVENEACSLEFVLPESKGIIRIIRGDYSASLKLICAELEKASKHSSTRQQGFLEQYISSFRTGSLHTYRDSQRSWIKDKSPRVENIFGFVEPYRDPFGSRAEFEGLVAISDATETRVLGQLVAKSDIFIRRLPWATPASTENGGKGPFEKALFEPPDFTSVHTLAYCSSIIFAGINLPNYNDIRQDCGFKNIIIANRMSAESSKDSINPFVDIVDAAIFQKHKYPVYYWWVVLHELLGHGTGKMMVEEKPEEYNFDFQNRPINPLTGDPITSWYKPGQTWTGQFGDLATTVDECRAELVGAYLMDDLELLALLGFSEGGDINPRDRKGVKSSRILSLSITDKNKVTYNMYLQLAVDGLRGLQNFNIDDAKWGQAHSRAHFAILKYLLLKGDGFMEIDFDPSQERLTVRVDRERIVSHGKPAMGKMLLELHIFRCTADVAACRLYYEEISKVDGRYLEWREVVLKNSEPKWVFSQANTFVDGDEVVLREYPPTPSGVIQSWVERAV